MIVVQEVVILDALEYRPTVTLTIRELKGFAERIEVNLDRRVLSTVFDDLAEVVAENVAVAEIESHSMRRPGDAFPALSSVVIPILGDLNRPGLFIPHGVREILAEEPPAVLINDGHLVITQAVEVIIPQMHAGVVDQELPHFRPTVIENRSNMLLVHKIQPRVRRTFLPIEKADALVIEIEIVVPRAAWLKTTSAITAMS